MTWPASFKRNSYSYRRVRAKNVELKKFNKLSKCSARNGVRRCQWFDKCRWKFNAIMPVFMEIRTPATNTQE